MGNTIIDFKTDSGFMKLAAFMTEGRLADVPRSLDLDELLQKQAYADAADFADPGNMMFSIASPLEAYISAGYAEKVASELPDYVVDRINEACDIYGVPGITIQKTAAAMPTVEEIFSTGFAEEVQAEKAAASQEYGNIFDEAIGARALYVPEEAESLNKIAALKDTIPPVKMAALLTEFDAITGCDLPWIAQRVGTPEEAVFKKKANYLNVELGNKSYPIEDLAEKHAAFESLGINIDFDDDPYTIKLALERLPKKVQGVLNKIL